jgi:catechol 2,3-dioxygenase-like lactoylglutathione lyase family enzyme
VLGSALAHPTVFVRDLDRDRAFYETLGLTVSAEVSTGIFMTAGNGTIFPLLHRADATPPSRTIAAFQVDDLPGAVASLRARGVVFEKHRLARSSHHRRDRGHGRLSRGLAERPGRKLHRDSRSTAIAMAGATGLLSAGAEWRPCDYAWPWPGGS